MAYISKDVVAFWGGENLGNQLQRFIESLSGGKIIANEGANKILEIYSKKYFGSDVDFKKDIIPVFEDEFAFGIENTNSGYAYDLIINIDAKKSEIIHRLADGFAKTGGVFEEKTIEHTLSDGTVGEEIVSVPAETVRDKTTYENMDIYGIKFGENKGVFYTLFDNKVAVSNNIDSLKKIIDISIKKSNSLKLSPIFEKLINPILKNSDEVSYFNLEKLLPMVFKDKKDIPFFLIPFSKISSGNNYFDDGIATVNYVEIN
ncbi:hypothetical protein HZC20_02060 [Candidatus Peregrinibacteria bacterium]|nr:hypothetical protein [Candidatus Peregrinibacteria bacterium]